MSLNVSVAGFLDKRLVSSCLYLCHQLSWSQDFRMNVSSHLDLCHPLSRSQDFRMNVSSRPVSSIILSRSRDFNVLCASLPLFECCALWLIGQSCSTFLPMAMSLPISLRHFDARHGFDYSTGITITCLKLKVNQKKIDKVC